MEPEHKFEKNNDDLQIPGNSNEAQENNTLFSKTEEEISIIKKQIIENKENANQDFKNCINQSEEIKYTEQLHIIYFNRGLCFLKMNDLDKAIENFSKSLENKNDYEKALYNRMMTLKTKGEYIDSLSDLEKLKLINDTIVSYGFEYELRNLAEKKKQQMQQEMLGQLKDVGNKFLGLFGLSTDNFKVNQGEGGGYNISFQQ